MVLSASIGTLNGFISASFSMELLYLNTLIKERIGVDMFFRKVWTRNLGHSNYSFCHWFSDFNFSYDFHFISFSIFFPCIIILFVKQHMNTGRLAKCTNTISQNIYRTISILDLPIQIKQMFTRTRLHEWFLKCCVLSIQCRY